jgi:hypothetical protein
VPDEETAACTVKAAIPRKRNPALAAGHLLCLLDSPQSTHAIEQFVERYSTDGSHMLRTIGSFSSDKIAASTF